MQELEIEFIPKESSHSEYDWVDLVRRGIRVGKARCLVEYSRLTIYSINIYPEYQGNGYGGKFVEAAKTKYRTIIADRVRYKAVGFWEHLGFARDGSSKNWVFCREE
jgi:GNAT superfamily N-acetyltransferase